MKIQTLKLLGLIICTCFAFQCETKAQSTLLTFDDLSSPAPVPNGYGGFNWNNFSSFDSYPEYGTSSGYYYGTISQNNCIFGQDGVVSVMSRSTPFSLLSGYFTAAWYNNLNLEIKGYNGSTLVYDNNYTLSSAAPSLLELNYNNITSIDLTSSGGTPNPNYHYVGKQYAIDNLTVVTTVPEPSDLALIILGSISMLAYYRRKQASLR